MGYYGFISKQGKNNYSLTVEFGSIQNSPYDSTTSIDKKEGLSKEEINSTIASDTLGTIYIYEGMEIGKLF